MNDEPAPKSPRDALPWVYWGLVFFVVPLVALWMAHKPASQATIPVLVDDMPAYSVIRAGDVMTTTVSPDLVTDATVQKPEDLVGSYTRESIRATRPISTSQVVTIPDPALISNTLAVAVPASMTTILGGNLQAGDIVSLATVPVSDTHSAPAIVFDTVLVLDVNAAEDEKTIVLAIPADRWLVYLAQARDAAGLVLARRVE